MARPRELFLPIPNQQYDTSNFHIPATGAFAPVGSDDSIVIVGANGAGKTRLGIWLELQSPLRASTHRVSAQKSLAMPDSSQLTSIAEAQSNLLYGHPKGGSPMNTNQVMNMKIGNRWMGSVTTALLSDFDRLLVLLFSEASHVGTEYLKRSRETDSKVPTPTTKLEQVRGAWERLLPHRELVAGNADIKTKIRGAGGHEYKSSEMSDGERVIFYLLGQSVAAPQDSVIVIDEPEIHVHKALQAPLWNECERLRPDCLFVYITHDVDFAASLVKSKKIWLKSFSGTSWDWEEVSPTQDFPENLLLSILGSRRPVLLVEGEEGSFDVELYRLLFPSRQVVPRGSCKRVIEEVRTLRANRSLHNLDVTGVIDLDRRTPAEVAALAQQHVYVLDVAEVENLFCVPEVLSLVSTSLARAPADDLREVERFAFNRLNGEIDNQISMRTGEEIRFQLNGFDSRQQGAAALQASLQGRIASINVAAIYADNERIFRDLIASSDYRLLLKYYNRKSLASQLGALFGLAGRDELPKLILRLATQNAVPYKQALGPYIGAQAAAL